jgi:hypothetical protein
VLIKHIYETLDDRRIQRAIINFKRTKRLHPIPDLISGVIDVELYKFRRAPIRWKQGPNPVMYLAINLENRRTTAIINRTVYICPHRCESKKAIVLSYVLHESV